MQLYPRFIQRDLTNPLVALPGRREQYTVARFGWNVIGGPESCEIEFRGNEREMLQWLALLRAGVEILDASGRKHWWGFVNSVSITLDGITLGVTLDGMANKVRVSYSTGTSSVNTDWSTDAFSLATFGTKELTVTYPKQNCISTEADRVVASTLNNLRFPIATVDASGGGGESKCTITCKGYFSTLNWVRYERDAIEQPALSSTFSARDEIETVGALYDTARYSLITPVEERPVLDTRQYITITGTDSFYLDQFGAGVQLWGNHNYHLDIYVYKNPPGFPALDAGQLICTGEFVDPRANHVLTWIDLTPKVLVAPGDVIAVKMAKPNYTESYYQLRCDTTQSGAQPVGPNSVSLAFPPEQSAHPYRLNQIDGTILEVDQYRVQWFLRGTMDNTQHIAQIAATAEFLEGSEIVAVSGLYTSPEQDGSRKGDEVVTDLLATGTANNRRLLAYVTPERMLRVYEEPSGTRANVKVSLTRKGELQDRRGEPLNFNPCGSWCEVKDIAVPDGAVSNPTLFFIESAEYDASNDRWSFSPRSTPNPWQVGAIRNE